MVNAKLVLMLHDPAQESKQGTLPRRAHQQEEAFILQKQTRNPKLGPQNLDNQREKPSGKKCLWSTYMTIPQMGWNTLPSAVLIYGSL